MGKTKSKKVAQPVVEKAVVIKKIATKKKNSKRKAPAGPKHYSVLYSHGGGDIAKYRNNIGSTKRDEIDPVFEEIENTRRRMNVIHVLCQVRAASSNGKGGQITAKHVNTAASVSPYTRTTTI